MNCYADICKRLRNRRICIQATGGLDDFPLLTEAADAIEELSSKYNELLKAAKAMHTWIFLNSGDEQAAYDECHLSDKMNAMLGYVGQFTLREPPKEDSH